MVSTMAGAYIASRGLIEMEADPEMASMMEEEASGRRTRLRPEDVADTSQDVKDSASSSSEGKKGPK